MKTITRRDFVAIAALGSGLERVVFSRSGHPALAATPVTAREIVNRISIEPVREDLDREMFELYEK